MDKLKGGVKVTLQGKEYTMLPTFEAITLFEEKVGSGLLGALGKVSQGDVSMKLIAAAVWSGIIGYYEERGEGEKALNYNQVGNAILQDGLQHFIMPVTDYLTNIISNEDERAEEEKKV